MVVTHCLSHLVAPDASLGLAPIVWREGRCLVSKRCIFQKIFQAWDEIRVRPQDSMMSCGVGLRWSVWFELTIGACGLIRVWDSRLISGLCRCKHVGVSNRGLSPVVPVIA